ncbi:MAG: hypothetical protein H6573_02830 [Lewinellaceae bacterium]|nr:hypothetical protein [Lewinellaceae bacterium]
MEAKDGSMGFDFSGAFTLINKIKTWISGLTTYRQVQVHFSEVDGGTFVMENFEAEGMNPVEMQKAGWQVPFWIISNDMRRRIEFVR